MSSSLRPVLVSLALSHHLDLTMMFSRLALARVVPRASFPSPAALRLSAARSFSDDAASSFHGPTGSVEQGGYTGQFGGERRPRQYDGERRPFDGERRPRQYNGERRPFDGERRPRQYDGEHRPFDGERRPRQYAGERRQFDGDRRPRQYDGEHHQFNGNRMSDLDKFRDRVASGKSMNAWVMYEKLMATHPSPLGFMDHVKLMGLLRLSNLSADFKRMEIIFSNLEKGDFDIPPPVYETMIGRSWRFSPELAEIYFQKMVENHGENSISGPTYAARMNGYRASEQYSKVLELAKEAESRGIDIHQFKPLIMDAQFRLGNKEAARATFDTFVNKEQQRLNLAKIHAWYANLLVTEGNLDEALSVLRELEQHGVSPSSGTHSVLMRVALAKNDLAAARDHIKNAIYVARRETYSKAVTELVQAHLDVHDVQGLEEFLPVYTEKYQTIPTQRFRPYMMLMEYHANQSNPNALGASEVERLYNMVPTQGKYNNEFILNVVISSLVRTGAIDQARAILSMAHQNGFPMKHPRVNAFFIETLIASNNPVEGHQPTSSASESTSTNGDASEAPAQTSEPIQATA